MSSTFRCSRDGKEYVETDIVMIDSIPVAKINLTEDEKKARGIVDAPAAEPEIPKEPETPQAQTPEGEQGIPASVPEGSLPPNDEGVQTPPPPPNENLG